MSLTRSTNSVLNPEKRKIEVPVSSPAMPSSVGPDIDAGEVDMGHDSVAVVIKPVPVQDLPEPARTVRFVVSPAEKTAGSDEDPSPSDRVSRSLTAIDDSMSEADEEDSGSLLDSMTQTLRASSSDELEADPDTSHPVAVPVMKGEIGRNAAALDIN